MQNSYGVDLELMPKELAFLIEILKTKNTEDNNWFSYKDTYKSINWDHFLRLAIYHRVYPIIYLKFKKIRKNWIPQYVIKTLHQEYIKNTYQMLKLSAEMERINELFNGSNIRLLFLKGPVIAKDLYGDISLRTSRDLDILISIKDLEKAESILRDYGYKRKEVPTPFWKLRNHHVTYFHPYKGLILEIHWRLHPQSINEPRFDDLWERRRVSSVSSYSLHYLGNEDLFFYLVAHGARHGWFRLRWLLDINQILSKKSYIKSDGKTINKFVDRHLGGEINYLGQALILVSVLFQTSVNPKMKLATEIMGARKLTKKTITYISKRAEFNSILSEEDFAKNQKRYLFTMKSSYQKLLFILNLFYPNPKDAEALLLPRHLRFLYLPLRPFLWAVRKKRKPIKR
ncbi:nucleotidyltransferase family protein [Bacillus sp. RHFB]|nr:nucleotidyltransferase family protein [Bacillus sp. RHFB]